MLKKDLLPSNLLWMNQTQLMKRVLLPMEQLLQLKVLSNILYQGCNRDILHKTDRNMLIKSMNSHFKGSAI